MNLVEIGERGGLRILFSSQGTCLLYTKPWAQSAVL